MKANTSSNPHWNITMLVIFVLLATSLFSLLAITQLQNLMSYWGQVNNFFRAHYLAKAGLELALTEVNLRDPWFQIVKVNPWDSIVTDNLHPWYEWFQPYRDRTMSSRSSNLEVILWPQKSITIPLFIDDTKTHKQAVFTGSTGLTIFTYTDNNIENMNFTEEKRHKDAKFMASIFTYSWSEVYTEWTFVQEAKTLNNIRSDKAQKALNKAKDLKNNEVKTYLVILNQSNTETWSFNIIWNEWSWFALRTTTITTLGHYWDTEVWLWASFTEEPPQRSF